MNKTEFEQFNEELTTMYDDLMYRSMIRMWGKTSILVISNQQMMIWQEQPSDVMRDWKKRQGCAQEYKCWKLPVEWAAAHVMRLEIMT